MFRSLTALVGILGLCAPASAQGLNPSRLHPVDAPVRDAGVFNWSTRKWTSGPRVDRLKASPYTVFRNDCIWTGGGFYYAPEHCEDVVDYGRIPSSRTPPSSLEGNPVQLSGATDDQRIQSFQFAYCTSWVTGGVDIQIGFFDNLRGECAAGIPTSPPTLASQAAPWGTTTAYFDFGSVLGNPLPGSSTNGVQSCWIVTIALGGNAGFCLRSEGDGAWDNDQSLDLFSWSFQHDNPNSVFGPGGIFIAGEPGMGGYGAGTYNLPAGSGGCGTGFGSSFDSFWLNIDGSVPGVQNTITFPGGVPQPCKSASAFGTNCWWFGGWPTSPLSSFWMVLDSSGSCSGCSNRPVAYCTAGTSASGCRAVITASGESSATAASGFYLNVSGVEGSKNGSFYYGSNGRQAVGWFATTSFQCVTPPVRRGGPMPGVGTIGQCDGLFSQDLNARFAAKPAHNPGPGAVMQAQFWYRDPSVPGGTTSLSNAIEWTVCP